MTPPDERTRAILDRIERRLPQRELREVSMFGAVAVMLHDAMVVAVNKDGSLLVRVDPEDDAELVARAEAERAEMGAGRSMGVGWIRVEPSAVVDDDILDLWMAHALRR